MTCLHEIFFFGNSKLRETLIDKDLKLLNKIPSSWVRFDGLSSSSEFLPTTPVSTQLSHQSQSSFRSTWRNTMTVMVIIIRLDWLEPNLIFYHPSWFLSSYQDHNYHLSPESGDRITFMYLCTCLHNAYEKGVGWDIKTPWTCQEPAAKLMSSIDNNPIQSIDRDHNFLQGSLLVNRSKTPPYQGDHPIHLRGFPQQS